MLEALQAAIEDPQKLKKEDYSLEEMSHELQSCRSPSDVENDPSYISVAVQTRNVISLVALPRKWLSRLIFLPVSWTVQIAKRQLLQVLSKLDLNSLFLKQIHKGEYWVIKYSHGPKYLHLLDLKIN